MPMSGESKWINQQDVGVSKVQHLLTSFRKMRFMIAANRAKEPVIMHGRRYGKAMNNLTLRKSAKFSAGLAKRPPIRGASRIDILPANAKRENERACVLGVLISLIIVRIVTVLPENTPDRHLNSIICQIEREKPNSVLVIARPNKL